MSSSTPKRPGSKPASARRPKSDSKKSSQPAGKSSQTAAKDAAGGPEDSSGQRLQKVLAAAGIGSRRKCEELILTGRVEVDRQVVTHLGAKADPARQEIRLDGQPLPRPKLLHFLIHKPTGVVSTNYDQSGRPRVIDLLPLRDERLFAVGRLDMSSEGLILVTNDGELANRLTHPRYGVEKTYHVEVAGQIDRAELEGMKKGVHLAEGFAHVESARVIAKYKQSTLLEIVLKEGRNREIRRLLARQGHKALRLKRVALGPLRLGELPSGDWRPITSGELRDLRQSASGRAAPFRRNRGPRKPGTPKVAQRQAPQPKVPTVIGGDSAPAPTAAKPPRPAGGKPIGGSSGSSGTGGAARKGRLPRQGMGPRKADSVQIGAKRSGAAPRKAAVPRSATGPRTATGPRKAAGIRKGSAMPRRGPRK